MNKIGKLLEDVKMEASLPVTDRAAQHTCRAQKIRTWIKLSSFQITRNVLAFRITIKIMVKQTFLPREAVLCYSLIK